MELEIELNKSVDENAGIYFEKAKKARKKLAGAREALEKSLKRLEKLSKEEENFLEKEKQKIKKERKREWYEKFHWFISSEGFLCFGGRDATSNEIVIKKHTGKNDLVFHTEAPGSPFFVIKDGIEAGEKTLQETAQAVAVYSRAWKRGLGSAEVYCITPEQVSKTAKSGEYLAKGSFMIYGKRKYFHPKMEAAIGVVDRAVIGGPVSAIESKTKSFVILIPGREKKSDLAKKIKSKLKTNDLDEISRFIPAGGSEIQK